MITEHEIPIPMPRFDITDIFGRNAIKRARYEYKRKAAECEGLHAELEEILSRRDDAITQLTAILKKTHGALEDKERMLLKSEDARKSLGDKLSRATERMSRLEDEIAMYKSKYELLSGDFEELSKEHERVIRALTDKEAEI